MGDYARELGRRIKERREALGYTQQDIANFLNKERSSVASWEAGRRMPDLQTFDELEAILGPLRDRSEEPQIRAVGGLRQLRGLLRAHGATESDIRAILHILEVRKEARRRGGDRMDSDRESDN